MSNNLEPDILRVNASNLGVNIENWQINQKILAQHDADNIHQAHMEYLVKELLRTNLAILSTLKGETTMAVEKQVHDEDTKFLDELCEDIKTYIKMGPTPTTNKALYYALKVKKYLEAEKKEKGKHEEDYPEYDKGSMGSIDSSETTAGNPKPQRTF